jgi:hypothetical protein
MVLAKHLPTGAARQGNAEPSAIAATRSSVLVEIRAGESIPGMLD